jgi:N-acetylmuramoyl-L-alanine amidase
VASLDDVGRTSFTRRGALGLGLAAGLGSLLEPLRAAPALGRAALPGRRLRSFGLTVTPADFAGTRTSRVLRTRRRFDLVGLRGAGRAELRVRRRGGRWSPWIALAAHGDHAPDTGTGERASDPLWSGGSDELQVRLDRAPRGALRLHMVVVPAAARRRAAGASARAARARAAQVPGTPPAIIGRDGWGAAAVPPRGSPSYGVVQMAFVHHTVTANEYTPADSPAIVLGIAKYHRDTNGWNDIGYNFLVDRFGQVFEGRAGGVDQAVVGAQAQGYNSASTGVALLGTHTAVGITPAAMAATAQLLGWKLSLHGVPAEGAVAVISGGGDTNRYPAGQAVTFQRISGHRDGDATSCPGDLLYAQLPELRRRATGLAGPVSPAGRVTLSPASRAVLYGSPAAFAGTVVRPGGTAAAGEAIAVQKRVTGGRWVTVARATADGAGVWATSVPWRRSGQVRARAAGNTSPVTSVSVATRVQMRTPRRRRVPSGTVLDLSGRVRPAQSMRVLVEIKGADGRYRRVRLVRARVRRTSWRAAVRMRKPGLYRITARSLGRRAGASDPLLVRVLR